MINEKQLIDGITRIKREKLECCDCLEDLRRKWYENDKKLKECEERKTLLTEKLSCLQRLKDDLIKRGNQLMRDEDGIGLIKQLIVQRSNEKEVFSQIEKTGLELCETKEKSKYFVAKSVELKKLLKHMQIASEKLSEKIDGIIEKYEEFEANINKEIIDSFEHKAKRLKVDTDSNVKEINKEIIDCFETKAKRLKVDTDSNVKELCVKKSIEDCIDCNFNIKPINEEIISKVVSPVSTMKAESDPIDEIKENDVNSEGVAVIEMKPEVPEVESTHSKQEMLVNEMKHERCNEVHYCDQNDADNTQLAVVSSMNGDKFTVNKWDVTTRDITVVRIVNAHVYIGCINGVIKRINPIDCDDSISYHKDAIMNKRVKALFLSENDTLLFACFDDGLFSCFDANSGQYVCEHRLKSYVVVCVEAWGEIVAARGDKQISFLSLTTNITQLRKINIKGRFQAIIAMQPLDEENGVRRLLVLGKGWKPIIINAMTGEYLMALANQAIYSPAFTILNNSTICTAFTQTPESLKYKDSILSFYNLSKSCERIKMEFMNGCVTAMRINCSKLLIALLRFNFTRLLCYDVNDWKLLWVTLIGYERVFALDFNETSIYFGCRNGCLHLISFDERSPYYCVDNHCNCKQPFALQTDLRHTRFH